MNLEQVFGVAGQAAMLGWLALALAPYRFKLARYISVAIGLVLAALYAALIGTYWGSGSGGFGSLAGVQALFMQPGMLLAGWVHYLAFDLLVGTWEREEAAAIGLPQWLLIPCLGLTFLFGPIGWLLFMAMRFVRIAIKARGVAATAS